MIKEIKIYNNDVIRFGNKFCYSNDSYKFGRSYEVVAVEKVADIIAKVEPEVITIADMEDKKAYVIGECSHSNGWTTDYIIKINNHIYVCSDVEGHYSDIDISVTYNIDTHSFEIDEQGYAIISDEDEEFIEGHCC